MVECSVELRVGGQGCTLWVRLGLGKLKFGLHLFRLGHRTPVKSLKLEQARSSGGTLITANAK